MSGSPEIGERISAAGIGTNVHVRGDGSPVVLVHGSGPGVTAWANWRLTIPALATAGHRVVAPDMAGFGFTDRPADGIYDKARWLAHLEGVLDALKLDKVDLVGNSFGGALAIAFAAARPTRVRRLVLMGSVATRFPITDGLERVWGYEPSIENMKGLLDVFAYSRELVNDELAEMRYRASIQPGFQEAFSSMFPAPRQRWIDALATDEERIRDIYHRTLVVHGREDRVIPLAASLRLAELLPDVELHVFGRCGHWTQIEHATRFNALVTSFFD